MRSFLIEVLMGATETTGNERKQETPTQLPNPRMFGFDKFQQKIHSFLLKEYNIFLKLTKQMLISQKLSTSAWMVI